MSSGRIFVTSNGLNRPILPKATRYPPSLGAKNWREREIAFRWRFPTNCTPPMGKWAAIMYFPPPVLIGGTVGTIAGSMVYGGSNNWIRPLWLISAGLFMDMAETTAYPIVSASSVIFLNMTPDFVDLATESSNNFWVMFKSWIVDLLFFLTTAAFAMEGVRYAYLEIAEFPAEKTRLLIYGKAHANQMANPMSPPAGPLPIVTRCSIPSIPQIRRITLVLQLLKRRLIRRLRLVNRRKIKI